jgi:2'-hydroxyisoflavone reductase
VTSRREFLRASVAAGGVLATSGALAGEPAASSTELPRRVTQSAPRQIRLLILGGTGFIGPWQVRYAQARGHEVTIFNRGRSAPGMFPGVEELIGDRAVSNLESLRGRRWDAVIDNSASLSSAPAWVRDSAALLRDAVDQYLFISTRSVFRDLSMVPATVDAPLYSRESPPGGWSEGEDFPYGLAKALAEGEVRSVFGARTTVVRPGLIVGPGDDTDRFTYWPVRIERGGEVLAPGNPDVDRVQVIDVRDLCEWVVRLCEQKTYGTYMGLGPEHGRSMGEFLYGIAAVTTAPVTWTWVPREFLAQHRMRAYQEMPVWRPPVPGYEGFARFDLTREVAAGLTYRSLADTTTATLEFHHSRSPERKASLEAGTTPEREAEVLRAWHASRRG